MDTLCRKKSPIFLLNLSLEIEGNYKMGSMHQITSAQGIQNLGTILGVWAHPDDESFTCAGIMNLAVSNGQKVICVTATKGEAGVQDESRWPPDKLGEIRAAEMAEGLKVLGVKDHHWLNYPDGGCADVPEEEAVAKLKKLIDKYQPNSIMTFGPEGLTGHPDHHAVSRWASLAAKSQPNIQVYQVVVLKDLYEKLKKVDEKFNLFFNIDKPPLVKPSECAILLNLPKDVLHKKYQCLCAMPSQTESMFTHFGERFICEMISAEGFVAA